MTHKNTYVLLFRVRNLDAFATHPPFAINAHAESADMAEKSFLHSHPSCEIVWVYEGDDFNDAYDEYWSALSNADDYTDFDARR